MFKKVIARDHASSARIANGPRKWEPAFRLITLFANPEVTFSLSALVGIYGVIAGSFPYFALGAVAFLTLCIGSLLKLCIRRVRPDTTYVQSMRTHTFSFPSGHSVGASVLYGSLGWQLATAMDGAWSYGIAALTITFVFLVGYSRVYLGAHYISDVLAGWLLGGLGFVVYVNLLVYYARITFIGN